MEKKVLVTGAGGFIGTHLISFLLEKGWRVRALGRQACPAGFGGEWRTIEDIRFAPNFAEVLHDCEAVIHLAGLAHQPDGGRGDESLYRDINARATADLAKTARQAGVKHFIFLSTIKVNGENSNVSPFTEKDTPAPQDAYSISKLEAEQNLWDLQRPGEFDVTVLRPPLVYGPGVKANFMVLMDAVKNRKILPLASVRNKRSLIFVGNLNSAIVRCLENPGSRGQLFLVSDGEDLSTPGLIAKIADAMGVTARLVPCPPGLLNAAAKALGKGRTLEKLTSNLQGDISKIRSMLNWTPPWSVEEALKKTVSAWGAGS